MIMRKNYFKISGIFLILLISILLCDSPMSDSPEERASTASISSEKTYSIDMPYEYPVLPGSDEWNSYSHAELIIACRIPPEVLESMTTSALLDSVLNYPLIADMLATDQESQGYQNMCKQFNGLAELASRKDAFEIIQEKLEETPEPEKGDCGETIARYKILKILSDHIS
jgi:hypothetical protein